MKPKRHIDPLRQQVDVEYLSIYPPIKIIKSENYELIIQDNSGKYYYFNKDGTYDGWSMDVNFSEN